MSRIACLALLVLTASVARADPPQRGLAGLDEIYPKLDALYIDLHRNPELSMKEDKTAARLATELRALGYQVTTGVGGTGVVGVLKNGAGPTVLLRTELDALPIEEKTGLPYASTAKVVDRNGKTEPAMHACGHDIHMAGWTGAAALLARHKDLWHGTVVMIGQPGEVKLQITVRTYSPAVRKQLLDGIARIAKAEAASANAPREPEIKVSESQDATYNDPALAHRLEAALVQRLGKDNVVEGKPDM